uniref:SET domain-containing protein n=1 Tax=Romanomermis culicivorax TaxID=13658 RepID=A0A915JHR8_ROMCU
MRSKCHIVRSFICNFALVGTLHLQIYFRVFMYSKSIFSSTEIFLILVLSELFYVVYSTEPHVLSVKFNFYMDDQLVNKCKEYIFDNLPDMWFDPFTPKIAKCEFSSCRTYPLIVSDGDTSERRLREENLSYARASVPCFLYVAKSSIPGAGVGLFTRVKLPKGILLGPYIGSKKRSHEVEKENHDRGYAVWISKFNEPGEDGFYIDGIDESNSNYLRYINSDEEEKNLHMLFFNDSVYCATSKEIEVGQELLAWYGRSLAAIYPSRLAKSSSTIREGTCRPRKI